MFLHQMHINQLITINNNLQNGRKLFLRNFRIGGVGKRESIKIKSVTPGPG